MIGPPPALAEIPEDMADAFANADRNADPATLSALHAAAAECVETLPERRFHLTHAWVLAMEAGASDKASMFAERLIELGALTKAYLKDG